MDAIIEKNNRENLLDLVHTVEDMMANGPPPGKTRFELEDEDGELSIPNEDR